MEQSPSPKRLQLAIEAATVLVNAVLSLAFLAAHMNLASRNFRTNNLTALSEGAFYIG